jgi:hypothetical protein
MLTSPRPSLIAASALVVLAALAGAGGLGCPARRGFVPMAGSRYPSTLCVFGLRGVRAAVDDCDTETQTGSLDVTLTMNADTAELRRRAHALIENAGYDAGGPTGAALPHPEPLRTPVHSVVEDVPGGVRIHVTPIDPADLEALRDEIEARIERASDPGRCP